MLETFGNIVGLIWITTCCLYAFNFEIRLRRVEDASIKRGED